VALAYATNEECPTLLEIRINAISRGASLSFLSQYPREKEILFHPLSYLEMVRLRAERELEIYNDMQRGNSRYILTTHT